MQPTIDSINSFFKELPLYKACMSQLNAVFVGFPIHFANAQFSNEYSHLSSLKSILIKNCRKDFTF